MPMGATVAAQIWKLPTTFCLDLRPIPQEEMHACKFSQDLMAGDPTGPRTELTTVILLKVLGFELFSKFSSHHP